MKNLEFTLNLNRLKREVLLKEEKLAKLQIESLLKISSQSEELKAAALKIEKLENLIISSKTKSASEPFMQQERQVIREKIVENIPEISQGGPDWKEIVDQLKLQLKLKTEIIKNMQKIRSVKTAPKPVLKTIERSSQTEENGLDLVEESKNRKELNYYKAMLENQEILKEELYSFKVKAENLQSQSLENETLKLQLLAKQDEVGKLKTVHELTVGDVALKQSEIDALKLKAENDQRLSSMNMATYKKSMDELSAELLEANRSLRRLERLRESFQLEIKLLKENLKSFDLEINQMTHLKLDSLKEQRLKDLETINESYADFFSNNMSLHSNNYPKYSDVNPNPELVENWTFEEKKRLELYHRSVENLFGNNLFICRI